MKSIFAEIALNMSIKDANSRIIDLWRQWYKVIGEVSSGK